MFGNVSKSENKRFLVKEEYSMGLGAVQIWLDTVTGVNYLITIGAVQNGIMPLLDSNGNVVIDK